MRSTLPASPQATMGAMVAIEARRFARHPLFLVGAVAAYVVTALVGFSGSRMEDLLACPVIPAFFIGLTSLVVAARQVRSTDAAEAALGAAPHTESVRTLAVAGAAVVPFVAGLLWLAEFLVLVSMNDPHPNEWWFATMNDAYVWAILLANGPVACLGGALLGVLVGRWLTFPGAPAVAVVVIVIVSMVGQLLYGYSDANRFRLWLPSAFWHSGSLESSDTGAGLPADPTGIQGLYNGNPVFYLLYLLALCGLAVGGAVWHDRAARTSALRAKLLAGIGLAVVLLGLAMFTGIESVQFSAPVR